MINKRGFTLLELLVVIAIISVLSVIAMLNFNSTRSKARDSRRMQEFSSFAKGLDLYYDLYGMYPCGDHIESNNDHLNLGGSFDTSGSGCDSITIDSKGFLNGYGTVECDGVTAVAPQPDCPINLSGLYGAGILSTNQPSDPLQPTALGEPRYAYAYHVSEDRQKYILATYLEDGEDIMLNEGGLCNGFYEVGNAVGQFKPWKIMACYCSGHHPICD